VADSGEAGSGRVSPRHWLREQSSEVWQPRHMRMGPDIMVSPALMDITAALMDTIPALTTLIKPIPTASMGKLIDAITRLTVVITTAGNSDGERRAQSP
jgi:hypothetical protein